MRPIDADGSFIIHANDNTGYSLAFGGGIISAADDFGHIVAEFDAWDAPTIDPESLRERGEWVKREDDYCDLIIWRCSLCHAEWCFEADCDIDTKDLNYNYCPNCGARMTGEE